MSITPIDRSVEREDATQTAADILDVALSEDSLGLTPPKAVGRCERAASGPRSRRDLMPHRAVLRSASGARKARASPRHASPAELKKLRGLQAVAPPVGASVEARLAALEAGSAAHFAYMQEAGPAIQALQVVAGNHERRLDEVSEAAGRQALEQAELVKATRRELFAVRDLLGEELQTAETTPTQAPPQWPRPSSSSSRASSCSSRLTSWASRSARLRWRA